jgi:hypothetical protein
LTTDAICRRHSLKQLTEPKYLVVTRRRAEPYLRINFLRINVIAIRHQSKQAAILDVTDEIFQSNKLLGSEFTQVDRLMMMTWRGYPPCILGSKLSEFEASSLQILL